MSWEFNSCSVNENDKEATLKCRLKGFDPKNGSHSAHTHVSDNTLLVEVMMDGKKHVLKVQNIEVSDDAVKIKPAKDEVNVIVKKPNKGYSLKTKMPY